MKGDDIAERLLEFAARVIRMADALPQSPSVKHICGQVVRAATSAGANYEEARGAESDKDFIHKLGICLKELRETRYWLKIIVRAGLVAQERMKNIIQEADELCRIIGKSIITSKQKLSKSLGSGAPGSCARDEGRPLATELQDLVAKRLALRW